MADSVTVPIRALGSSYDKPFRGLPAEVRLAIWKHIVLPSISVTRGSSKGRRCQIKGSPNHIEQTPGLVFDPCPATLASLRLTDRTTSTEVRELLTRHGIALVTDGLYSCCTGSLLERFRSLDNSIPIWLSVRAPALGVLNGFTIPDYLEQSLEVRWNQSKKIVWRASNALSGPMLARLDWCVDMPRIYSLASEEAAYGGNQLEMLNDHLRTDAFVVALAYEGFLCFNIYAMLKSGFAAVVALIFEDSSPEKWAVLNGSAEEWRTIPLCDKADNAKEVIACKCVTRHLDVITTPGTANTYVMRFVLNEEFDDTEHDESHSDRNVEEEEDDEEEW